MDNLYKAFVLAFYHDNRYLVIAITITKNNYFNNYIPSIPKNYNLPFLLSEKGDTLLQDFE